MIQPVKSEPDPIAAESHAGADGAEEVMRIKAELFDIRRAQLKEGPETARSTARCGVATGAEAASSRAKRSLTALSSGPKLLYVAPPVTYPRYARSSYLTKRVPALTSLPRQ